MVTAGQPLTCNTHSPTPTRRVPRWWWTERAPRSERPALLMLRGLAGCVPRRLRGSRTVNRTYHHGMGLRAATSRAEGLLARAALLAAGVVVCAGCTSGRA